MIYGNAAVMGIAPCDVDRMSLAQWIAVSEGWNRAHNNDDTPPAPSREEFEKITGRKVAVRDHRY